MPWAVTTNIWDYSDEEKANPLTTFDIFSLIQL